MVILVACGVLGFVIAFVNLLIILVITFNTQFHNSQATYKFSLAIADFIVGAIVLPLAVDILRRLVWTRHLQSGFTNVDGYPIQNGTVVGNLTPVEVVERAGQLRTKFPLEYEHFAGSVTAISIFVSVYTLAGAGFDRLRAVYNPLSYRKERANKLAKRVCIVSWLIAILFGILPIFTPNLGYALVLSITFATLDFNGLILYSVGLFVPLIVVWIVNIFTFTVSKKHSKFRRQLTQVAQRKRQKVESRLAHTLQVMVATFTINTLPLIILLISSLFLPSTRPSLPHQFNEDHGNLFITLEFVAVMMLFGNSLWNFIIYSCRNRDFRVAVKLGFEKIMKALCFAACVDLVMVCCRSVARSSRRRFSSLQSISFRTSKARSFATVASKLSHGDDSVFYEMSTSRPTTENASLSGRKTSNFHTDDTSVTGETSVDVRKAIRSTNKSATSVS